MSAAKAISTITSFFSPTKPSKNKDDATADYDVADAQVKSKQEEKKPTPKKRKANEEKEGEEEQSLPVKKSKASGDEKSIDWDHLETCIHPSWQKHLAAEFKKPYWSKLKANLKKEIDAGVEVFPPAHLIFRALEICPFDEVKVVIIGQDPYHDNGQAEGLCFSVPKGVTVPSSLRNIYKELASDIKGFVPPKHGHLLKWAEQGVLLLNITLTVKAHAANSHKSFGWSNFTDAVVNALNRDREGLVFLLWGAHAQNKAKSIDKKKHHALQAAHPSGLSASKGFYGCKHFSKCNEYLQQHGKTPIDWTL